MKTNQVLVRNMGEFDVVQRTYDGFFDANALLIQWNKSNKRRRLDHFLNYESTKEFIDALIADNQEWQNFTTPEFQVVIKARSKTNSMGIRIPANVWIHPLLFIDFAMWIKPAFKVQVLKFVYD